MDKYKWDLSYIYKNDDEFIADVNKLEKLYASKSALKGKINNKENYIKMIEIEEQEEDIENKLYLYSNKYSLDQTNLEFIRLLKKLETVENEYREKLSWIAPELDEIKEEDALSWIADTKYAYYEMDIKEYYRLKKHRLNKEQTELLSKVAKSRGAASSIYSELTISDAKTPVLNFEGKEYKLTQSKYSEIMKSTDPLNDQELRKQASIKFYERYYDNKFTLSTIYQKIAERITENTKLAKFDQPLEGNLYSNNIPKDVYFKLLEVAKANKDITVENSKSFADYLKTKYKLKNLWSSDGQLELFSSSQKYEIDDAIAIIAETAKTVSEEYYEVFKRVVKPGFIDYMEGENKVKGAYSTGNTIYDPLILMNWSYDIDSVLTLAHEIGHSIHTIMSNENQKQPYQGYSIYVAEVASTLLESLVIDDLLSKTKDSKEKMFLLDNKLSTQIATFFRQAQFADFEHTVIDSVWNGKIYDHEEFAELFREKAKEYGASGIFKRTSEDMKYVWTRISHFFGSPYYVYQYATCMAATYNFIDNVKSGKPEGFINMIKSGSVEFPNDLFKMNGIDLTTDESYQPLINSMRETLDEIKELYKEL